MKFPFLASVLIFCFILRRLLRREDPDEARMESFWEREQRANFTRKKSLDNLDYITIPFDTLPFDLYPEDQEIASCIERINALRDCSIVNFTGLTNTDLKLAYGAGNITKLMTFDQNYTKLVQILQKWAALLYEKGSIKEATALLEFAVSTRTDVSESYRLLIRIYNETDKQDKIADLLPVANSLNSASKEKIVRIVQESCP